jgi:hypothetical protein
MFRSFSMIRRLTRAARVLGAHGVLPPPEWAGLAPPQLRLLALFFRKSKAAIYLSYKIACRHFPSTKRAACSRKNSTPLTSP